MGDPARHEAESAGLLEPALKCLIEPLTPDDWTAVRSIYLEGIATGHATFEKTAPEWDDWDARHLRSCRIVARSAREVFGWAALTPVSGRCVYAGVAEVSIYVAERARGRGIGLELISALVKASETQGVWTLQAGIFPENQASIALHKRAGFRIVGTRERLGQMDGRWRDVMLMERRSRIAGL
jgi:L-amino acid N-acyltransferase YncA